MADTSSFLQVFAVVGLIGIFFSFIIRVSIQALILRYFTKRYELPQEYGKAWLAVLIPSLIITLLVMPVILVELPSFLLIILWLLFFPILILSVKSVYKTEMRVSAAISLKLFLVLLVAVTVIAGSQTLMAIVFDPIEKDVPQSICNVDCEYAHRTADLITEVTNFTITGYNIPSRKYNEKEKYIIAEKYFDEDEVKNMRRGVNGKIIAKLDAHNCNYMDHAGYSGGACQGYSKNIFINFVNILVS